MRTDIGLTVTHDFITEAEEAELLSHFDPPGARRSNARNAIKRYGSDVPYRSNVVSRQVPGFLRAFAARLVSGGFLEAEPDSVTVNEYLTGQCIMPHIDSDGSGDIITVLSLLGHAQMVFDLGSERFAIEFPPRTLVQMRGEVRRTWKHSVPPVPSPRYSVVFRCSKRK